MILTIMRSVIHFVSLKKYSYFHVDMIISLLKCFAINFYKFLYIFFLYFFLFNLHIAMGHLIYD